MFHNIKNIIYSIAIALLLSSCNLSRFVADDEYVLKRNQYDISCTDTTANVECISDALTNINNYAYQHPNKKIVFFRLPLLVYSLSNPDNNNWLNRFLRDNGESPIVWDEISSMQTINQIKGLLDANGCFNSNVTYHLDTLRNKQVKVVYDIKATPRYTIDEVVFNAETDSVRSLLRKHKDQSLLKIGDYYNQENLSKERDRVALLLQNEGYFLANKELITFVVDTTYSVNNQLGIELMVHNPSEYKELETYRIGNVIIYPNTIESEHYDTSIYMQLIRNREYPYTFIHNGKMSLSPKILSQSMFLFPGFPYRPRHITNTYNTLLNLHNLKYIDIQFTPRADENIVDAHIRLLNANRRKVGISLELTNASPLQEQQSGNFITNGNLGIETVLNYQNRNLFGGAEILNADASLLVELPKLFYKKGQSDFYNIFSAFEAGLNFNLDIPQFLLPFTSNIGWQRARPHTIIGLSGSYQYRSYFERDLVNISYGYSWRQDRQVQHQLFPIELSYVKFFNIDEDFLNRLNVANPLMIQYQYSNHFVLNARYNYTYNNQQYGTRQNFNYINASLESAGNLLYGFCLLTNNKPNEQGQKTLFDVPFSQYLRLNLETKRYFYHGKKNTFVTRLLAGIGLPYANSIVMPYEKSFFGGSPTTIRAWQLRKLGPGGYVNQADKYDRIGDMQLVVNLEERFPIISIVEGALFTDIGNVWLLNPSEVYPDGEFKWNRFYKELGVGVGFGIRLNISLITIRLDFAIPLYDPGFEQDQRWRLPNWKLNQIVTNLGINYPF